MNSSALIGGKFIFQKKNPLLNLLSIVNAKVSTLVNVVFSTDKRIAFIKDHTTLKMWCARGLLAGGGHFVSGQNSSATFPINMPVATEMSQSLLM